jgi:hypothetical protein
MNIKIMQAVLALIPSGMAFGQSDYVEKLPLVSLTLHCRAEDGSKLGDVEVTAHDDALGVKERFRRGEARSDEKGTCHFKFHAISGVSVYAIKRNYYASSALARNERPIDERFRFDPFIRDGVDPRSDRGDELPMKSEVKLEAAITLRKIRNPIPLYGKRIRMDIPARDVWLGYDFEAGDWVEPHGEGARNDMRIRSKPKPVDPEKDDHTLVPGVATLEVDFGEGGGLVRVNKDNGWLSVSDMKMPHVAPETGYEQLPTLKIKQEGWDDSAEREKAEGYFFRTRVKREGERIVSAHYGKLLGRINYIPVQRDGAWLGDKRKNLPSFGSIEFIYYFNPTANDRNLEFDLKKNLFKRLEPEQWLRQP